MLKDFGFFFRGFFFFGGDLYFCMVKYAQFKEKKLFKKNYFRLLAQFF
jgi:hypothetical protein